jgi:hypothetical protein
MNIAKRAFLPLCILSVIGTIAIAVIGGISILPIQPARAQSSGGSGSFTTPLSVNQSQVGGTAVVLDPCQANVKTFGTFSGTASAQIIAGVSAKKVYICSWNDQSVTAQNIAVVEGTGSVCATGIATMPGLSGGTTAATGWNAGANGGRTFGVGGFSIAGAGTNADNVCVLLTNAVQTNIGFSFVTQ